jgi:hypothetical protein
MNDRPKLVILDGQIFVEKTPNLFDSPKDYLTNWQSEKNTQTERKCAFSQKIFSKI